MQTFLIMATSQKIMHSSLGNAAQTQQQHQLRMKTPAKSSCTISCSIKHEVALEYSLYPIINSPSFNAASKLERALAIINSSSFIKFAHSFSVYAVQKQEVASEYSLYPIINSPSFNAASKLEQALAIINSPSLHSLLLNKAGSCQRVLPISYNQFSLIQCSK